MQQQVRASGSCLCGAVALRVPLVDVIGSFVANDEFTLKSSGGAAVEFLHLPSKSEADVTSWISNDAQLRRYVHNSFAANAAKTVVLFCGTCSTKIAIVSLPSSNGTTIGGVVVPRGVVGREADLTQFTLSP